MAPQEAHFHPQYFVRGRASRGLRPVGELFAIRLKGIGWLFGRVIRNDCAFEWITVPLPWPRNPGVYLVYVYSAVSDGIESVPSLSPAQLLFPPSMVNRSGWSLGYFTPLHVLPLSRHEVRGKHCFWSDIQLADGTLARRYVDEYGNRLRRPCAECSDYGLGSAATIERDIAMALKLPYVEA